MPDYRRTNFERRMKAYRDHLRKKELDSKKEDVTEEEKQTSDEDKKKLIEMWQNMTKKK